MLRKTFVLVIQQYNLMVCVDFSLFGFMTMGGVLGKVLLGKDFSETIKF